MERVAKFSKVSFEQYAKDFQTMMPNIDINEDDLRNEYDAIKLPVRATSGSAGYDFFLPHGFKFTPGRNTFFPTGIRCEMTDGWVLQLYPKSGLGTKYGTHLLNVVGIVDADYAYSDNEGHILIGLSVKRDLELGAGSKIVQGIFIPFGITEDDEAVATRNGGFGSTM